MKKLLIVLVTMSFCQSAFTEFSYRPQRAKLENKIDPEISCDTIYHFIQNPIEYKSEGNKEQKELFRSLLKHFFLEYDCEEKLGVSYEDADFGNIIDLNSSTRIETFDGAE